MAHAMTLRWAKMPHPAAIFWPRFAATGKQPPDLQQTDGIRTVLLRTGIVLDANAGALAEMTLPFRFGVGGPILPGTQWAPWIHLADEIGLIEMALEDTRVHGPLNAAAPEPVTYRTLSTTIGQVMRSPAWLPVPGILLRLLFGEFATTLTHGQRVIPTKAQALGYRFRYPTLEPALRDLLHRP